MRHLKLLFIPIIALLLGGCSTNTSSGSSFSSEPDYSSDLAKYDLNDSYLYKDYQNLTYFTSYNSLIPDSISHNVNVYRSYDELEELKALYQNSNINDVGQITYINNMNQETFDNYNVIFSPEYTRNNPSYSYYLNNIYLKDNNLYLHIVRNIDKQEGVGYPEVIMHTCFAFQIQKSVQFNSVNIILSFRN